MLCEEKGGRGRKRMRQQTGAELQATGLSVPRGILTGVAVLVLLGLLSMTAGAEPLTSTSGFIGSDSSIAQSEATPASPVNPANLRGSATSTGSISGACPGVTCGMTNCACTTFTGTLTGSGYGKVAAVIAITENDNNTTPNGGFGFCFPAAGTATLTTPGSTSVAVLGLSGALCQFSTATTGFTVNGNFAYSEEAKIGGTNKFATSFGTGNISVMESVDQAVAGVLPAQVSAVGTLQLKH
jgi:hypothetical protein